LVTKIIKILIPKIFSILVSKLLMLFHYLLDIFSITYQNFSSISIISSIFIFYYHYPKSFHNFLRFLNTLMFFYHFSSFPKFFLSISTIFHDFSPFLYFATIFNHFPKIFTNIRKFSNFWTIIVRRHLSSDDTFFLF